MVETEKKKAAAKESAERLQFDAGQSLETVRMDAAEARDLAESVAGEKPEEDRRELPPFRPGLFRHGCACLSLVQGAQEPCDCGDPRRFHHQFVLTSWYDVQAELANSQLPSAPFWRKRISAL